jgi:PAS domain S-box-containing protein
MKEHGLKQFRVLVADDDSSILDFFQQVLSRVEIDRTVNLETGESESKLFQENASSQSLKLFDVVTCQQGDEAVDAVKSSIKKGRPFSVAFIDIRMPPGPDGIWTAEHIRAFDSNIEIVIFTGYSDTHPRDITRRVPPAHKLLYIQKPFNSQEIYQFVSALSMKWHTECELQRVNKGLEKSVEARTQELKESEENFRALAENANDGILIAVGDGKHVFVNKRTAEITGYSISELLKTTIKDLAHPDEFERIKKKYRAIISGKSFNRQYETKIIRKNGKEMPIEVSSARSAWQGQPADIVIIRDLTERVKAEEVLKKGHNELEHLVKERTLELNNALKTIKRSEKELTQRKLALEQLNRELIETNQALSILARNIDRDKNLLEKKIYEITSTNIIPIINELQDDKSCQKRLADLELLKTYMNGLIPGPTDQHEILVYLSSQEMRVAAMIKHGLTSPKIAEMLNVSLHTVKTHRKSIRKKLKLQNSNINLCSYLRSKMVSDSM